jgi:hypothetical protein
MQHDGNLVISLRKDIIWTSGTNGQGVGPYRLILQKGGNLVIYDGEDNPIWATNTEGEGEPPYRLVMQTDGNLVV